MSQKRVKGRSARSSESISSISRIVNENSSILESTGSSSYKSLSDTTRENSIITSGLNPKLKRLRISCFFRKILDIDMAKQNFTVQFTLSVSWKIDDTLKGKKINNDQSIEGSSTIKSEDGVEFWSPRLRFVNRIDDFKEEDVWWRICLCPEGRDTMCEYNMRAIGVFEQQMLLQHFPVDSQQLSIHLQSGWERDSNSKWRVYFEKELTKDSLVKIGTMKDEYGLNANLFDTTTAAFLIFKSKLSDEDESASSKRYPTYTISAVLTRRPFYHISNVWLPTCLLTILSTFCLYIFFSVPQNKNDSIADELTIVVTTLLATVQYRQDSSGKIACIPYLTLQDIYIICCIGYQFACGFILIFLDDPMYIGYAEKLVDSMSSINKQSKDSDNRNRIVFAVALTLWILFTLGFLIYLYRTQKHDFADLEPRGNSFLWIRGGTNNVGESAKQFRDKLNSLQIKVAAWVKYNRCKDVYGEFNRYRPYRVYYFSKKKAIERFEVNGDEYDGKSEIPFFVLEFNKASEANNWKLAVKGIAEFISSHENVLEESDHYELHRSIREEFDLFFNELLNQNHPNRTQVEVLSNKWREGLFGDLKNDSIIEFDFAEIRRQFSIETQPDDSLILQSVEVKENFYFVFIRGIVYIGFIVVLVLAKCGYFD